MPAGQFDRGPGSNWYKAMQARRRATPLPAIPQSVREERRVTRGLKFDGLRSLIQGERLERFPAGRVQLRPWQDQLGRPEDRDPGGWL